MKFSSLACLIHDWLDSAARSVVNKTKKSECAAMIGQLEAKLSEEPAEPSRVWVVKKLKRDLEALRTPSDVAKKRGAPANG